MSRKKASFKEQSEHTSQMEIEMTDIDWGSLPTSEPQVIVEKRNSKTRVRNQTRQNATLCYKLKTFIIFFFVMALCAACLYVTICLGTHIYSMHFLQQKMYMSMDEKEAKLIFNPVYQQKFTYTKGDPYAQLYVHPTNVTTSLWERLWKPSNWFTFEY